MRAMVPRERLDRIVERFEYIEARMTEGDGDLAQLGREYAELRPVVWQIHRYRQMLADIDAARAMLDDPEMRDLAAEEIDSLQAALPELELSLKKALLPYDAADARPAILEIRPGTGGEEAALFAGDLMRMYQRHAETQGWRFEVLEEQGSELGGIRELVARVAGAGAFARLKFESGVHRVQRVPETESGGRIHTSAATVAVLPEPDKVDVEIDPGELRIDTMRASGAGGQHVNTTDSAVRITHVPTGFVVTSSQKSQHRNREIALEVLRARLFDMQRRQADRNRAAARAAQVGSGDRSERIRTYNFPQGRVTDHRINLTLYKLDQVMGGDLDELIDALAEDAQAAQLAEMS